MDWKDFHVFTTVEAVLSVPLISYKYVCVCVYVCVYVCVCVCVCVKE